MMFTGIITDIGRVRRLSRPRDAAGGLRMAIASAYDTEGIALGASIACSGVCLTVVALEPGGFEVDASAETLARSTIGEWREGDPVNLERALRVGDELGGHIVSGHVDAVARIADRRPEGDSVRFGVAAPPELMRLIATKGSIALDGVSLTVNEIEGDRFGVNIIPHTLTHTGFGEARPGQRMNLEIDPIARYVARLMAAGPGAGEAR
jgi:riboflavin synthase